MEYRGSFGAKIIHLQNSVAEVLALMRELLVVGGAASIAALILYRHISQSKYEQEHEKTSNESTPSGSALQSSAEDESGRCDREEQHSSEPEDWIVASHTVTLWTRAKLVQFHHRHLGWADTAEYSDDKLRQVTVCTIVVPF